VGSFADSILAVERGFDRDKDHLVALVVDTTVDGPNRFGLFHLQAVERVRFWR
jgi:hypothetical protein